MVKKFIVFVFVLLVAFSAASVAFGSSSPGSDFTFSSSTGVIAHYNGPGGAVKIPSTIGGVAVTSIGSGAFNSCSSLRSITIPSSVTSVGDYVFDGCKSLTSVTIPSSVAFIGDGAFRNCSSLRSINIPRSVRSIGVVTFSGCARLTSVTIPSSVTSIRDSAFAYCTSLTSITIPGSVRSIGNGAFSYCPRLNSAIFKGAAPTVFGLPVFYRCASNFLVRYYRGQSGWSTPKWGTLYKAYPVGSTNAYLAKRTASTGLWNHWFSRTRYSYLLTISHTKSSAKVAVTRANSKAKVYWSYSKSHWHFGATNTVKVSRGHSKCVYFKVVSQCGMFKTYTVKVYRKR